MTREEHLNWCKKRAMEYVEAGDSQQAVTSMLSDLGKHPDTKKSLEWAGPLGVGILLMKNKQRVVEFIEGFN
jgi:hypothetical protein